ncbi:MAG: zinc ribbon domain-containing protein [Methanobacteriota archaeon]|nr:MAG: zinc ribbon domain-containing protein [Euryarchaeota archaeon]
MADLDANQMILIAAMLLTLSVVGVLELRYMRSRRKVVEEKLDFPDRAHNAILTTKAIGEALARGGVRSPEADELVREAESASRERNFRVAIDLAERAKGVLRAAKLDQQRKGDVAKVDTIRQKGNPDEVTPKERLMKELPANYAPSKFSMNLARDDIAAAKGRGQATAAAEKYLADAEASFNAEDYDTALKHAVRARRSLGDLAPATETSPPTPSASPPVAKGRACANCGAPLGADDGFCRKCGTKIPPARTCPSCGAKVADEDAFCRACGTEVP